MESAIQLGRDLKRAVRGLLRDPRFGAAAVLTLGLGAGANTAIFSAIDAALFRPLPVSQPDRLAAVYGYDRKTGKYMSASWPEYEYLGRHATSFSYLAAYVRLPLRLTTGDLIERVAVEAVTANYFEMLGLPPVAGRAFSTLADTAPNAAPAAMMAEGLWRSRFRSDPAVIGAKVVLQGRPFIIAGIVPARYRGASVNWGDEPQLWVPLSAVPILLPRMAEAGIMRQPGARWLVLFGRLRDGIAIEKANAEVRTLAARLENEWPASHRDFSATVFPGGSARFWPSHRDAITRSLAVFAAAAMLVLLLACANISGLLLERAMGRRREIAVKLALGASRGRLLRQMLAESLVLAVPGVAAAVAIAAALQELLTAAPNAFGSGLRLELALDARVFLFCAGLTCVATFLAGLLPALRFARTDPMDALRERGAGAGGRLHMRNLLVAAQVALSVVLLVTGGLFARTLLAAYSAHPGFETRKLLLVAFDLPPEDYGTDAGQTALEGLRRHLATLPGVESATLAANAPLSAAHQMVQIAGGTAARCNIVGPDYLRTLGIPILSGRDLAARDTATSPRVVIVNQTLAARLWPDTNPIGQTLQVREGRLKGFFEVIGVSANAKYESVWDRPEPYLYFASAQARTPAGNLILRTAARPEALVPASRQAFHAAAGKAAWLDALTGGELLDRALAPERAVTRLLAAFAALAAALAAIGIYGLVSYSVRQRTREIGIRTALGAAPHTIFGETLRYAAQVAVAGAAAGTAASAALAPLLRAHIRDLPVYDPLTYAAVLLLIGLVTLAAAIAPARRAARLDPLEALRQQ